MAQKVFTGSRARFFFNGSKLGHTLNITITETIGQELVQVLDNLAATEVATVSIAWTIRVRKYRIPNEDIVTSGLWPAAGRTPDELKRNLLNFGPLSADVYDSHTDAKVAHVWGVYPQTRTMDIQARGLVSHDCTFIALGFSDEGSPDV